jgi:hypothetical protein
MATSVQRVEKDFLLKVLFDQKVPVTYFQNRVEYTLTVERLPRGEMSFKAVPLLTGLKVKQKMHLRFTYHNVVITFSVFVTTLRPGVILTTVPESLYKNLARSYARVIMPPDLSVQFNLQNGAMEQYSLSFPKIAEYEQEEDLSAKLKNMDPKNLSGLVDQMRSWLKRYVSGYKMVFFKNGIPSGTEEGVVAATGKILYLPSSRESLPKADPYPVQRLVTEDLFFQYLGNIGVEPAQFAEATARFVQSKLEQGIFSDAWIPIIFHQYVIGYIHIWISKDGLAPISFKVIEAVYQFTKVLAFSLKVNGFFERGRVKSSSFKGNVLDISASGLLFAYPLSDLHPSLMQDAELSVKIKAPNRVVNTGSRIVRTYKSGHEGYFGCQFIDLAPEDERFLFEFFYGKPFDEVDAAFISGQA